MGSKESSGSISTISQERPPHSEQMLICVNFKQFKSILGFSFTNLSNQCWNDSKDKYRISTILGHYCIELVSWKWWISFSGFRMTLDTQLGVSLHLCWWCYNSGSRWLWVNRLVTIWRYATHKQGLGPDTGVCASRGSECAVWLALT